MTLATVILSFMQHRWELERGDEVGLPGFMFHLLAVTFQKVFLSLQICLFKGVKEKHLCMRTCTVHMEA